MSAVRGRWVNGQIVLDGPPPADWADGLELRIELADQEEPVGIREEDWPTTPEGIAALLARMDAFEPVVLTDDERAAWERRRAEDKAWELANERQPPAPPAGGGR
jgi:hypothetical protein